MRIVPPSDAPMTWALAASAVVHAGIAVALVTGPAGLPSAPMRVDLPLRAEIATPLPPLEPLAVLRPVAYLRPAFAAPGALASDPSPMAAPRDAPTMPDAGGPLADVPITAVVLADRNRLGPLLTRQMAEFPVEIDSPVHVDAPIVAHLPASVLADPASEPIVVWAVVGWNGEVEEVQLAAGDAGLADGVLDAVRQARFVPARNGLVAHRYPIALEFRWGAGDASTAPTEVAETGPGAAVAAVSITSR
jgi:hypothetical protein